MEVPISAFLYFCIYAAVNHGGNVFIHTVETIKKSDFVLRFPSFVKSLQSLFVNGSYLTIIHMLPVAIP